MQLKQNFHVNGTISFHDYDLKGIIDRMAKENIPTDIDSPVVYVQPTLVCSECNCIGITDICKQCSVPYCCDCFKKLHSHGKAFRRHRLVSHQLKTNDLGEQPSLCSDHGNEELSYFCVDCKLPTCVQCNSNDHIGHDISTMILEVSLKRFF